MRTSIQLIAIANPFQSGFGDIVKGDKVVVSRDSMYGFQANLL